MRSQEIGVFTPIIVGGTLGTIARGSFIGLLVAGANVAWASLIPAGSVGLIYDGAAQSYVSTPSCISNVTSASPISGSCSQSVQTPASFPNGPYATTSASVSVSGHADFGTLGIGVSAAASSDSPGNLPEPLAQGREQIAAIFTDYALVIAPTLADGTPVTFSFSVPVNGQSSLLLEQTPLAQGYTGLTVSYDFANTIGCWDLFSADYPSVPQAGCVSDGSAIAGTFSTTVGSLIILQTSLFGSVFAKADASNTAGSSASASLDYSHTLNVYLAPITPGVTLLTGSGNDYAAPAANVPEPATVALLGLSLAGLGFSRRRQ